MRRLLPLLLLSGLLTAIWYWSPAPVSPDELPAPTRPAFDADRFLRQHRELWRQDET